MQIILVLYVWSEVNVGVTYLLDIETRNVITITFLNMTINKKAFTNIHLTRVLAILAWIAGWVNDPYSSTACSLSVLSALVTNWVVVLEINVLINCGLSVVLDWHCLLIWLHKSPILLIHPFVGSLGFMTNVFACAFFPVTNFRSGTWKSQCNIVRMEHRESNLELFPIVIEFNLLCECTLRFVNDMINNSFIFNFWKLSKFS